MIYLRKKNKSKVLKFGFGNIGIGSVCNVLFLCRLEKQSELLKPLDEDNKVIEYNEILFNSPNDVVEFEKLLRSIDGVSNTKFEYQGLVLDFTQYNEDIIKQLLEFTHNIYLYLNCCLGAC